MSSAVRRLCLLGSLLVPAAAHAGNGTHPRTPVLWEPAPACMTIVDRTVSPVLELTYTIPYEDLRPADATDEVDDSRQHQFLAFCRGHSVQEPMPTWLSEADVAAADLKDLVPDGLTPEDILDTSTVWKDCLVRITGDDQRRPITFVEADKPVVWDTTGLPVGPYVVDGYTWEPTFNIFSLRNGVVKVIDDPDPATSPPALAIRNGLGEEIVYETESLNLYGCVSAMDGSTLTGYWAHTNNEGGELVWNSFAEDTPVSGDEFELPFAPPAETVTKLVALKIEITDPMDRSFTAHMDLLASVLPGSPATSDSGCDSMGFIADPGCEGTGSTGGSSEGSAGSEGSADTGTTGAGTGTDGPTTGGGGTSGGGGGGSDSTGPEQTGGGGGEGCGGCAVGGGGGSFAWLLGLWCVRRRRVARA